MLESAQRSHGVCEATGVGGQSGGNGDPSSTGGDLTALPQLTPTMRVVPTASLLVPKVCPAASHCPCLPIGRAARRLGVASICLHLSWSPPHPGPLAIPGPHLADHADGQKDGQCPPTHSSPGRFPACKRPFRHWEKGLPRRERQQKGNGSESLGTGAESNGSRRDCGQQRTPAAHKGRVEVPPVLAYVRSKPPTVPSPSSEDASSSGPSPPAETPRPPRPMPVLNHFLDKELKSFGVSLEFPLLPLPRGREQGWLGLMVPQGFQGWRAL